MESSAAVGGVISFATWVSIMVVGEVEVKGYLVIGFDPAREY